MTESLIENGLYKAILLKDMTPSPVKVARSREFLKCMSNRIVYPDVDHSALALPHYGHLFLTTAAFTTFALIVLLFERYFKQ